MREAFAARGRDPARGRVRSAQRRARAVAGIARVAVERLDVVAVGIRQEAAEEPGASSR
jgi:hypothetical protein